MEKKPYGCSLTSALCGTGKIYSLYYWKFVSCHEQWWATSRCTNYCSTISVGSVALWVRLSESNWSFTGERQSLNCWKWRWLEANIRNDRKRIKIWYAIKPSVYCEPDACAECPCPRLLPPAACTVPAFPQTESAQQKTHTTFIFVSQGRLQQPSPPQTLHLQASCLQRLVKTHT